MNGQDKKIFDLIRQRFEDDKRTQEALAELIGCSQSFISNIKSGKQTPAGKYYRRICEVLGLDANTGMSLSVDSMKSEGHTHRYVLRPQRASEKNLESMAAPVLKMESGSSMEAAATAPEIPPGFVPEKISDEEWGVIESLRASGQHPDEEIQRLKLRISSAPITPGQRVLVLAVLDGDYIGALGTLSRLIETKHT